MQKVNSFPTLTPDLPRVTYQGGFGKDGAPGSVTPPAGGGESAPPTGNAPAAGEGNPPAVPAETKLFNEEQQTFINNLIGTKYGEALDKGRNEGRTELQKDLIASQAKLAELQATLDKTTQQQRKAGEGLIPVDQVNQQITQLQTEYSTKISGLEAQLGTMRGLEKNTRITSFLTGDLAATNNEQVAMLLQDRFVLDDSGALRVLDENGRIAIDLNRQGQPMLPEVFISGWLAKNPWFLKSSAAKGAGSGTDLGLSNGTTINATDIAEMSMDDFQKNYGTIIGAMEKGQIRS